MAVSPTERRYLLSQVNRLAAAELNNLWTQADRLTDVDFAAFVIAAFPEVVDPWVAMAGQLAASWFEESLPASSFVAATAELPPTQMLTSSAEWALGAVGDAGRGRLEGTMQRAVFNGARDTTSPERGADEIVVGAGCAGGCVRILPTTGDPRRRLHIETCCGDESSRPLPLPAHRGARRRRLRTSRIYAAVGGHLLEGSGGRRFRRPESHLGRLAAARPLSLKRAELTRNG
jgi:hypothetical protein